MHRRDTPAGALMPCAGGGVDPEDLAAAAEAAMHDNGSACQSPARASACIGSAAASADGMCVTANSVLECPCTCSASVAVPVCMQDSLSTHAWNDGCMEVSQHTALQAANWVGYCMCNAFLHRSIPPTLATCHCRVLPAPELQPSSSAGICCAEEEVRGLQHRLGTAHPRVGRAWLQLSRACQAAGGASNAAKAEQALIR